VKRIPEVHVVRLPTKEPEVQQADQGSLEARMRQMETLMQQQMSQIQKLKLERDLEMNSRATDRAAYEKKIEKLTADLKEKTELADAASKLVTQRHGLKSDPPKMAEIKKTISREEVKSALNGLQKHQGTKNHEDSKSRKDDRKLSSKEKDESRRRSRRTQDRQADEPERKERGRKERHGGKRRSRLVDSSVILEPQIVFESDLSEEEVGARGYRTSTRDSRNVTVRRKPAKVPAEARRRESSEESKLDLDSVSEESSDEEKTSDESSEYSSEESEYSRSRYRRSKSRDRRSRSRDDRRRSRNHRRRSRDRRRYDPSP
jgi:hypothetical protein